MPVGRKAYVGTQCAMNKKGELSAVNAADRLSRLEDKLDRIAESVIRTEEQLSVVRAMVAEHDARTVQAIEAAAKANERVNALEVMFSVPFKWVKIMAAIAGALTAVYSAWKLLGKG